ncbi:MAG: DUF433 domain-containing protein, partial [Spirosomataceae bacterium]
MKTVSRLIISNHQVLMGKPIISGTRISVEHILRKMAEGANNEDIKAMYPTINDEHIFAVLE